MMATKRRADLSAEEPKEEKAPDKTPPPKDQVEETVAAEPSPPQESSPPQEVQEDHMQAFLNACGKLSPADLRELSSMGFNGMPIVGDGVTIHDAKKAVFGYQCRDCRKPGLYFAGSKFIDSNGNECSAPPLNVHISRIPWTQPNLEPQLVHRGNPHCQHCGAELPLTGAGNLQKRLVIHVEKWLQEHKEAVEQMRNLKVQGTDPAGGGNPRNPSSIYDEMDPTHAAALKAVANQVHLGEMAFGRE